METENKVAGKMIQTKTDFPWWIKAKCFFGLHYWLRYSWDGGTYRCLYCKAERKGKLTDTGSLFLLFFTFLLIVYCTISAIRDPLYTEWSKSLDQEAKDAGL